MKTYDNTELKEIAIDIFNRYPKSQKISVTSDGQAFITDEGDNSVKNHSVKNGTGKVLAIVEFTREECIKVEATKQTVKEITEVLATATIDEANAIKEAEAKGENRSTVIKACEKRVKNIEASEAEILLLDTIAKAETIESIEAIVATETEGKKRENVLAACETRIQELKK